MKSLVNIADVETFAAGDGERFEATHGLLSAPFGGQKIGASVTHVAPGKAAFPFHHDHEAKNIFSSSAGPAPCATAMRSFR